MLVSLVARYTHCMINQAKSLGRFLTTLAAVLFLGAESAQAANHYIRAGASGANNGSDWTNAWSSMASASFTRGDTYYVADGLYSGRTLNTPASGTALITIKKAVIADHGTAVGWVDAYGDGQAEFNSGFDVVTSYWTLDGVTGGGPGQWETNFGFFINMPASGGQSYAIGPNTFGAPLRTGLTFQHMDIKGRGRSYAGGDTDLFYIVSPINNLTIRYSLLRDTDRTMILSWPAGCSGITIEYNKFARNGTAEHREAWSAGPDSNVIVRHNLFEDIMGTGVIAIVNNNGTAANWDIHGNVFYWTGRYLDAIINTGLLVVRYDFTAPQVQVIANNWKFHNNVIANIRNGSFTTALDLENGTGNSAKNNIWYNNSGDSGAAGGDYNWFYANQSNNTAGPNDIIGSANPFADAQPWLTGNWALKAPIAGFNVGAPYNVDMLGSARGADGTWDRGAIEFTGGVVINTAPSAPTGFAFR